MESSWSAEFAECRVRGVQSSRSAEFAEPAEIGRVKSGMVAEDGDVEVGRLGENLGEEQARPEPVGKPYGFSGYLLENPTVLQGRRN